MDDRCLRYLLENQNNYDYFVIESFNKWYDYIHKENREIKKIFFIALPLELKKIIKDKTIDTITYLDVLKIRDFYIDTNIILNEVNYNPFQLWQKPFYDAIDIIWINNIHYIELIWKDFNEICLLVKNKNVQ